MEGDDFVTEDVVTWCDVGWDGESTSVVVSNQSVGSPGSRWGRTIDETTSLDLEELECGLVVGSTVTSTLGEVVDDWSVMRLGPCGPLELNGSAGRNSRRFSSVRGILVADDVSVGVLAGSNEAVVLVLGRPADNYRWVGHIHKVCAVAFIVDSIDDNSADVTVRVNLRCESNDASQGGELGERHRRNGDRKYFTLRSGDRVWRVQKISTGFNQ